MKLVGPELLALQLSVLAGAQPVADHLKCYKVRDPQAKAAYTADLGGLVAEPGCTIKVPATMVCVPATKENVNPPPQGTGATGAPNAFGCYKVHCPKATLPTLQLNDQFGSRAVTPRAAKLLCAPAPPPTTYVHLHRSRGSVWAEPRRCDLQPVQVRQLSARHGVRRHSEDRRVRLRLRLPVE